MPLYIPWLTEGIKKRGVRYLLHHYLGQFFEEKLTLEQLSIDIYEGRGSIRNLSLDVDGLNDELDFIPFKFLDGCSIGQISVEVPWSSLATEACTVELEGAKFVCRLKTSADGSKAHCTESTLLSRSLMTSSMQMAEDIVTTEDDDEYDSPNSSVYRHKHGQESSAQKKKDANQMFEGLEMFAQLIDSVLRRTKLTARNTLFQIQPYPTTHKEKKNKGEKEDRDNDDDNDDDDENDADDGGQSSSNESKSQVHSSSSPISTSPSNIYCDRSSRCGDDSISGGEESDIADASSEGTVEFLIKFFRCEEILDNIRADSGSQSTSASDNVTQNEHFKRPLSAMPETITKLLTLEDVEMRIGGIPVSNLIGKHTIMIKFNGQKSEISIFSGSPLLAVIGHQQLKTFFNVFDGSRDHDNESSPACEKNQRIMSPEDYAKIENQLLESASLRTNVHHIGDLGYISANHVSTQNSGRRWVDSGESYSNIERQSNPEHFNYHSANSSSTATCLDGKTSEIEPSLDSIEAFSCELKLPGIWLCILRDGETLPPLIKPYADSINSFQTINKYIDEHIDVPHIRFLALKVALDITIGGINVFLGDLDISEHLKDDSISPTLHLLHNDMTSSPMNSPRYKALIMNNKEITVDLLTKTRIIFDPTMIDRIVYDYKLIHLDRPPKHKKDPILTGKQRNNQLDLNLTIRGEQFKVELLCPIPDLTPEARSKLTQLRPQSFLFDFKNIVLTWQSDKLNISAKELLAYVKTQPQQSDNEAIKFIEAMHKNNDKIILILEPYPSNLDTIFPNDVEQALNESSMYDSIYVGQETESRIPTEAFQTKRKVVRASTNDNSTAKQEPGKVSDCDREKILTPGDRQHLLDYLNQTVMSTKLSLSLHLPVCEVEFEDKEQLDLIYNRFGNDFVFWQPKAFMKNDQKIDVSRHRSAESRRRFNKKGSTLHLERDQSGKFIYFKQPTDECSSGDSDQESEVSFHSLGIEDSGSELYDNDVTCKIIVDELYVRFNHQSCAAALKQEISIENLLLGVVIDVNKKPGTVLSLVGDNLELATDLETVLEGNTFGDKNSIFSLTAEIKRPTKSLKDIKLAIQLVNGLFNDFTTETYTRFWQSINVTDEPILGYVSPKIVTELHVDILNTALSLIRDGARPALLSIDELYLTSMVMEKTSQVMIRLIADEVSLYLKRNKQGLDQMKNYICLIDSGLIDLDIKFSQDGRLEFGVINNVITVRACQDSLTALCRLFNVMVKGHDNNKQQQQQQQHDERDNLKTTTAATNQINGDKLFKKVNNCHRPDSELFSNQEDENTDIRGANESIGQNRVNQHEMNLLEDAMNDFSESLTEKDEQSSSEEQDEMTRSDSDSDSPPVIQQASNLVERENTSSERDPNTCLLDESNSLIGDLFPQPLLPTSEQREQNQMNQSVESFSSTKKAVDESGFFVIGDDDVGAGIMDRRQQEPVVRKLIDRPITIMENHFKMTKPRTIPEMLAASLERYVLEEMTLVVNLYGGRDFDDETSNDETSSSTNATNTPSTTTTTSNLASNEDQDVEILDAVSMESGSIRSRAGSLASNKKSSLYRKHCTSDTGNGSIRKKGGSRRKNLSEGSRDQYSHGASSKGEPRVRFGEGAVNLWESLDLMSSPDFLSTRRPSQPPLSSDLKIAGGTWRQTDVCIQLTLTKVKLLYELGGENSPISWRFMLFIHDIEIKDRIHASDINKMLYEYCTESMPRRNTQILTIKNIATINPSDGCEECDLRVSLKPLRLNIDQDTLIFLIEFFTSFGKSLTRQQSVYTSGSNSSGASGKNRTNAATSSGNISGKLDSTSTRGRGGKDFSSSPTPSRADGYSGDSGHANQSGRLKQQQQQQQQASSGKDVQSKGIEIRKSRKNREVSERSDTSLSFGSYSSTASFSSSSSAAASSSGGGRNSSLPNQGSAASLDCTNTLSFSSNNSNNNTHEFNKTKSTSLTSTTNTTTTTHVPSVNSGEDGNSSCLPTHCHKDNLGSADQHPIYIKSFTFSPDVPIRLDYHAKHLDFEQGALAGILMGLAHLDHSELVLRRVQAKHGMRGLDRVLLFALNSWMSDIKRNQLPSILSGVGPMHSVIQLFQGMRDLIWMPIDHYRKDRRLVRGLQRGASSFSSSTAMATINLMNRFISIVQCTAQIAHDIVTPPTFQSKNGHSGNHHHHHRHHHHRDSRLYKLSKVSNSARGSHSSSSSSGYASNHCGVVSSSSASSLAASGLNQPRNFCEGVAVGFTILKEGFNDTARNVAVGMQAEDVRSAVGELVRQIPSTLLNPIISATEGAQNVLVGIRNQIAPDARREDQEKWKRRVRGK